MCVSVVQIVILDGLPHYIPKTLPEYPVPNIVYLHPLLIT